MGGGFGYGLSLARVGIVLGPKIGYHFYSELVKIKQGVNENNIHESDLQTDSHISMKCFIFLRYSAFLVDIE